MKTRFIITNYRENVNIFVSDSKSFTFFIEDAAFFDSERAALDFISRFFSDGTFWEIKKIIIK